MKTKSLIFTGISLLILFCVSIHNYTMAGSDPGDKSKCGSEQKCRIIFSESCSIEKCMQNANYFKTIISFEKEGRLEDEELNIAEEAVIDLYEALPERIYLNSEFTDNSVHVYLLPANDLDEKMKEVLNRATDTYIKKLKVLKEDTDTKIIVKKMLLLDSQSEVSKRCEKLLAE